MAYGVFGSRELALLENEEVKRIAAELNCTAGAVLLAWARAKELVVVFGSQKKEHITANLSEERPVQLRREHMEALDALEGRLGTRVMGWKGLVDLDSVDS